ncbi:hypothetical protein SDC9_136582 [bioreactor metagenome]|uniref:Uncharacterized protein n=1 Tax=bioreactor metagenome TaxID=1076179 RepID=A0A645DKY4_9ZZZZ
MACAAAADGCLGKRDFALAHRAPHTLRMIPFKALSDSEIRLRATSFRSSMKNKKSTKDMTPWCFSRPAFQALRMHTPSDAHPSSISDISSLAHHSLNIGTGTEAVFAAIATICMNGVLCAAALLASPL